MAENKPTAPSDIACIAVLIPAYKPDPKLLELTDALARAGYGAIVVVDDGSGESFEPIFAALASRFGDRVALLRHAVNLGKGRALKTGLNAILSMPHIKGIVTADADGQHLPRDIRSVADALLAHPASLVLGVRAFTGDVPARSRIGNRVTALAYRLATGVRVSDTQTGLRGIPIQAAAQYMTLPGERYEYEMNMLMACERLQIPPFEVPIETVYIDQNSASHFQPLQDGLRIGRVLLAYAASSMLSFLIDYALFALLVAGTKNWLLSFTVARLLSSAFNFTLNYHVVFQSRVSKRRAMASYYALVVCVYGAGVGLMQLFVGVLGWNEMASKLLVDGLLAVVSYLVQRELIYKKKGTRGDGADAGEARGSDDAAA